MKVEVIGNIGGRLCVFNCLDSERGREIYEEMIGWLAPLYEVYVVWHDGSRYEYEGLMYMKELVEKCGRSCLYLHTKGACNKPYWSRLIREMWRREFGDKVKADEYYFKAVDDGGYGGGHGVVACPVLDHRRIPLYNGFVVNRIAMELIDINESEDRFVFEKMWQRRLEVEFKVMKYFGTLSEIHRFLKVEYEG